MRSGGFFAGAGGGLALALLLIGLVSLLPQSSSTLDTASTQHGSAPSVTTTQATNSPVASKTTNGSAQAIGAPPVAQVGGNGVAASASSSSETSSAAGANASSFASSVGSQARSGPAAGGETQAQQKPSSLLAVLPGESLGSLIATISPLLIGLLVAALFYGAYVRRQDSS